MKPQKPAPQHYLNFSIGRSGFHLAASLNSREEKIGVELYLDHEHAKAFFHLLVKDREQMEQELGFPLDWQELPHRAACRIVYFLDKVDPKHESRWPEFRRWMIEHLEKLDHAFRRRVRVLNPEHYLPSSERSAEE